MRYEVLCTYIDRLDGGLHSAGEEVELSDERGEELSGRGFVKRKDPPRKARPRKAAAASE